LSKSNDSSFFDLKALDMLRSGPRDCFFWFASEALPCVAGKTTWGVQKYYERISTATREHGAPQEFTVTVTDEAFCLLLLHNKLSEWIESYERKTARGLEEQVAAREEEVGRGGQAKAVKQRKRKGKYTSSTGGNSEYGGWSNTGLAHYKRLKEEVIKDRIGPHAAKAEEDLLKYLRSTPEGIARVGVEAAKASKKVKEAVIDTGDTFFAII